MALRATKADENHPLTCGCVSSNLREVFDGVSSFTERQAGGLSYRLPVFYR